MIFLKIFLSHLLVFIAYFIVPYVLRYSGVVGPIEPGFSHPLKGYEFVNLFFYTFIVLTLLAVLVSCFFALKNLIGWLRNISVILSITLFIPHFYLTLVMTMWLFGK